MSYFALLTRKTSPAIWERIFFGVAALGAGDVAWRFFTHNIHAVDYFLCTVMAGASALWLAWNAIAPHSNR